MDTTDPEISFDSSGLCNHCSDFLEIRALHSYKGLETDIKFKELIVRLKKEGIGKKYDCIIGLSGGIDSSYVAYIAKKHGLRVLGVHMDNGWNSEEAVRNIKNIADILGIDYESYVLDWEEFKEIQVAFLKASVPEADTPTDIAILASLHRVAAKYGVKNIISGGNFATEGILPKNWHYNAKDLTYFKYIHKRFGKGKISSFPTFGFRSEMYYKFVKGIKMVYLLNYIPYNKDEAIEILKEKLNWKYYGGKHYESKYTGFIQSYYLVKKFNIDYRRATLSSQICIGVISREQSLEILKSPSFKEDQVKTEKEYIAKKLGITLVEFEEIINFPPHWYSDYPNDEKWLGYVYNTYRKIFKREKLASF
jgi:N-acetyl sugar amidotransferase